MRVLGIWFLSDEFRRYSNISDCASDARIYGPSGGHETTFPCRTKMGSWTSGLLSFFPTHLAFCFISFDLYISLLYHNFCGSGQSRAHPREIMTEVLKALQELNVYWKKIGHYNMKCRWLPGYNGNSDDMLNNPMHPNHSFGHESAILESDDAKPSNVVKFEVQVCSFSSLSMCAYQ